MSLGARWDVLPNYKMLSENSIPSPLQGEGARFKAQGMVQ